jgi:hypothetical protein
MKIYRDEPLNDEPLNNEILHSLRKIQAARTRLDLLNASNATPIVLVSQIGFCDTLLQEIQTIQSNLKGRTGRRGSIRRRAVVAKALSQQHTSNRLTRRSGNAFGTRRIVLAT